MRTNTFYVHNFRAIDLGSIQINDRYTFADKVTMEVTHLSVSDGITCFILHLVKKDGMLGKTNTVVTYSELSGYRFKNHKR